MLYRKKSGRKHTLVKSVNATALRKLVGKENTGKNSEQTASQPPAKGVTEEVDLLTSLVLGPEADTAKKERPLDRNTGVRVAAGEGVVMVEHGALKLKVLLEEGHVLDLARLLLCALRILRQSGNVLGIPDIAGLEGVLVTVDLSLLICPFRQRGRVSPHGDLCRDVNELEVDRHGLEVHARLCAIDSDLKEGVVETIAIGFIMTNSSKLLVSGVVRRGDIVSEEPSVGHEMAKANNITDVDAVASFLGDSGSSWNDLPEVVGVVVGITSNLLTLRRDTAIVVTKGVLVGVTMEVDLGVLVANVDGVVVVDADGLLGHDVVAQSLLEFRAHEVVARAGTGENGKVNLEPEEVEQEGDDNETSDASSQVLAELGQSKGALSAVDVEKRPEINGNGDTDGEEGESTDVLGRNDAAEADTGQEQPLPPLAAEGNVTELVEADVAPD